MIETANWRQAKAHMQDGGTARRASQGPGMVYTMQGDVLYVTTQREGTRVHTLTKSDAFANWVLDVLPEPEPEPEPRPGPEPKPGPVPEPPCDPEPVKATRKSKQKDPEE